MPEPLPVVDLKPAVSPTGAPVMQLPAQIAPYAAGLVAIAAALLPILPEHTVFHKAAMVVIGLGGAFGIVSQGWRK